MHPGDPLLLPRPCFPNLVDLIDPNGLPLVPLAAGEEGGEGVECLGPADNPVLPFSALWPTSQPLNAGDGV